jgi:Fe-S cluster assembly iron-binding protein IscA
MGHDAPFLLTMNITHNARNKISELCSPNSPFRIAVTGSMINGNHVDLIANATALSSDVTICTSPAVVADFASINFLTGQTIDFDYSTEEFIISRI